MTLFKNLFKYLFIIFLSASSAACSIIDFSPEERIETNPFKENQIVGENEKLYVSFKFDPERTSAESLFMINDYQGKIDGSMSWEGNRMIFTPAKKMIKGKRYTFDYSGFVAKKEGGEVESDILIPFFYCSRQLKIPSVISATPPSGAVISGSRSIKVKFSEQMDTGSVRKGFSIKPETEHILSWDSESSELTIAPEKEWSNLTSCTLSFSPDICCKDGIPSDNEYNITYYCDSSHVKPEVASLHTVLNNLQLSCPRISDKLENIKYKDGIEIEFTQNMKRDTSENSLSFTPFTAGRKIWKNDTKLIFLPEKGWMWNKEYTLKISETAESEDSIASGVEFIRCFTPAVAGLILDSINGKPEDGFPYSFFSETETLDIDTGGAPPYIYSFTFTFSEPFYSEDEKEDAQNSINLTSEFPPDASSPFPVSFTWIGDRSLTVNYSGFTPYNSGENIHYYYMITVNGGENGIINSAGSFLSEEIKQLIRTK